MAWIMLVTYRNMDMLMVSATLVQKKNLSYVSKQRDTIPRHSREQMVRLKLNITNAMI